MPPPRDYDSDDEHEKVPLNNIGGSPFDERSQQPGGYSLSESYGPPGGAPGGDGTDPTVQFGVPGRAPSPYARADGASSTEAWRQRQAPASLRRYGTRKIRLQQQVLSIDYPVPSAIQNAVQAKYRQPDVEGGSEEFTHMRCQYCSGYEMYGETRIDRIQIPPPLVIPMISPLRMDTI